MKKQILSLLLILIASSSSFADSNSTPEKIGQCYQSSYKILFTQIFKLARENSPRGFFKKTLKTEEEFNSDMNTAALKAADDVGVVSIGEPNSFGDSGIRYYKLTSPNELLLGIGHHGTYLSVNDMHRFERAIGEVQPGSTPGFAFLSQVNEAINNGSFAAAVNALPECQGVFAP